MAAIQLKASDWEAGLVTPGFPIPPIGLFLGSRLESHDPAAGVLRVSFPTKAEYANPGGAVMVARPRRQDRGQASRTGRGQRRRPHILPGL